MIDELFRESNPILAMIHVRALPGTPRQREPFSFAIDRARAEARMFTAAGVDGLLIENMHDLPYLKGRVGPEIVATMTAVGLAVRDAAPLPLGVQILAGANRAALAVALACGAVFIRAENFSFAHVADEGLMPTADAGPLLRYRKRIGADHIRIFADVKKKHASHALTADISLVDAARAAVWNGADGVIVTGTATGEPVAVSEVAAVRNAVDAPIWIGSGVTPDLLPAISAFADGFIVGSYFKQGGCWANEVDPSRVARFVDTARLLRDKRATRPRISRPAHSRPSSPKSRKP